MAYSGVFKPTAALFCIPEEHNMNRELNWEMGSFFFEVPIFVLNYHTYHTANSLFRSLELVESSWATRFRLSNMNTRSHTLVYVQNVVTCFVPKPQSQSSGREARVVVHSFSCRARTWARCGACPCWSEGPRVSTPWRTWCRYSRSPCCWTRTGSAPWTGTRSPLQHTVIPSAVTLPHSSVQGLSATVT
jgi:hypothetical protein